MLGRGQERMHGNGNYVIHAFMPACMVLMNVFEGILKFCGMCLWTKTNARGKLSWAWLLASAPFRVGVLVRTRFSFAACREDLQEMFCFSTVFGGLVVV